MSTAKSLLKYAVGWDLTSEDSLEQPSPLRNVYSYATGGTSMTHEQMMDQNAYDNLRKENAMLRAQLAQAQAEIEDWRTKFQKALTP